MSALCCFDTARGPAPGHDRCARGEAAFNDLVPPDDPFSHAGQDRFDTLDEVALQFRFVGESFCPDPCLALRAPLPFGLVRFIAADMDERRGEEGDDLLQHVFEEREDGIIPRAEDVFDGPESAGQAR